jgi:glycosyltransferase involved in cell wall biosynthesis
MSKPYVIVTGDFTPWGGMDRPNYELAWYLAEQRRAEVHLVSHRVASPLASHPNVTWHRVPRPFGRHTLGAPLLDRAGRKVAGAVARAGGTVVVNGGNCLWNDVNWVHYVHNLPAGGSRRRPWLRRPWAGWNRQSARHRERQGVGGARLVITDSDRTRDHLIAGVALDPQRVHTIYYGVDPEEFRPASAAERGAARGALGLPPGQPVVAFIGALGHDRRKGFDVLFDAWCQCGRAADWDATLVAAGTGAELGYWQRRAIQSGRERDIRLLGFTRSIPTLLAAADALVSPTRYEPYGQGVHEALCCGVPAFVSRCAGIAERFPAELEDLLLDDPPDAAQLARRLCAWRKDSDGCRRRTAPFAARLRSRTWSDMAAEVVALIERCSGT